MHWIPRVGGNHRESFGGLFHVRKWGGFLGEMKGCETGALACTCVVAITTRHAFSSCSLRSP